MLQSIVFTLDVIRFMVAFGLLVIFILIGALAIAWLVLQIIKQFRQLAYLRRQRRTRKGIEKLFREGQHLRGKTLYISSDTPLLHPLEQADVVLTNAKRRNDNDIETLKRATEYRDGISE